MIIRTFQPEHDRNVAGLNTSFKTDQIYNVSITETGMELARALLATPFEKTYPAAQIVADLETADHAVVAEIDGTIAGVAAVKFERWNNRADMTGLFVAPERRQTGVGRALIASALDFARSQHARCLWVETQNTNYPAIQFYKKLGFRLCGFDSTLYTQTEERKGEIALFFSHEL